MRRRPEVFVVPQGPDAGRYTQQPLRTRLVKRVGWIFLANHRRKALQCSGGIQPDASSCHADRSCQKLSSIHPSLSGGRLPAIRLR